jgi:alpha/beta superfamily hydrolase
VRLEGLLHCPDGDGPCPAAVVCHPHPLGGGSMHNGVVRSIARALSGRGVLALRFNFRGVGRSGGEHDNGRAEQADVAGALDWLLNQPGVDPERVALVGYSFGAWVGLSHAQRDQRITATAAVGLVAWHDEPSLSGSGTLSGLGRFDLDFLSSFGRPKLFVTGEYDAFASPEAIQSLVDRLPAPKELRIMTGTDHFFGGQEAEVGALVADFIAAL